MCDAKSLFFLPTHVKHFVLKLVIMSLKSDVFRHSIIIVFDTLNCINT